jgi:hypothetical protein
LSRQAMKLASHYAPSIPENTTGGGNDDGW